MCCCLHKARIHILFSLSLLGVAAVETNIAWEGERVVYIKTGRTLSIPCPVPAQLTNSTTVWFKESLPLASVSDSYCDLIVMMWYSNTEWHSLK